MPFDGRRFEPNPGAQRLFLSCPVFECLLEGTRGGGKTFALLADFAQHVGKGYGAYWAGILFRQSFPQLADVVRKSQLLFYSIFPPGHPSEARFNKSDYVWHFKTGESLSLRHMRLADDYWNFHGHEYPWIGFEELTNWPTSDCFDSMKSCSRSIIPGMPRKIRATANPWGVGHSWVKAYFIDPAPPGVVIANAEGVRRVRLRSFWWENRQLMAADPEYVSKLRSIRSENKRRAWLQGDWNVVAGGIIDDLWDDSIHVLQPFRIPSSWRIDRSFDWGSSRPFSVCWWAQSDGTSVIYPSDGKARTWPRGSLFLFAEWYGWTGQPNEGVRMLATRVGKKLIEFEKQMSGALYDPGRRPSSGPADSAIFDIENGNCIADDMASAGCRWERADKSPGSRKQGLEKLRELLGNSVEGSDDPHFYVFNTCRQWLRTVPVIPRGEPPKGDPDDSDPAAEDHAYDATRYRVWTGKGGMVKQPISGH